MIKTWEERCVEHPDHQTGMVSYAMIQARMQEEIDELRDALEQREPLSDDEIKCIKPICADFVSFRAGVRHAEREHGIGGEHD